MQQSRKILFLTAPIGSGHTRAAQAIKRELDSSYPGTQSRIVNVFDFFHPSIGQMILSSYGKILNLFPALYGKMYDWGNDSSAAVYGRELISRYLGSKMKQFIRDYRPDGIVCTHASPAGLAAYLHSRNIINIPIYGVVTDFVIHRLWIYKEVNHYYIAHQLLQDQLEVYGVPRVKSLTTGIPVDSKFSFSYQREVLLQQMSLNPKLPVVLIMGGGGGLLPMDKIIASIQNFLSGRIQIVAVAGQNQKMYNQLTGLYGTQSDIRILRFVDNIHELMALSTVMITKPGGLTIAEALCMGLPMIIYQSLPGQEEGNADYLVTQKAALKANTTEGIIQALMPYVEGNQQWIEQQKDMILRLSRPHAALKIVNHLIASLNTFQKRS